MNEEIEKDSGGTPLVEYDLESGTQTVDDPTLRAGSGLQEKRGQQRLRLKLPDFEELKPPDIHFPDSHPQESTAHQTAPSNTKPKAKRTPRWTSLAARTSWIWDKLDMSHLKPVIRCAVAAWISMLLVVIWRTEKLLGEVRS